MQTKSYIHFILAGLISILPLPATGQGVSADGKPENTDSIRTNPATKEFQKIAAGARIDRGLFTVYETRSGSYYLEIPDSLLNRALLFGSRVSAISDNSKISAGQRRSNPVLIHFSVRDKNLFMHKPTGNSIAREGDPVAVALSRNNVVPVVMSFDIAARNKSNDASLIDVTKLFSAEVDLVFPAGAGNTGRLDTRASGIERIKSFPANVEIKSLYQYSGGREPFSITVNYSFILLPREPMRPRLNDPRIGYSGENKRLFESGRPYSGIQYIDRWRIEARESDREKHKRGELVEPEKPILFYIDTIMPEKWRQSVKTGIEDWNKAFEAIGFKNTIQARDFPRDKDFDPDDSRFNCFRYISSTDANAQGPQWIDPRSGEIIQGDILWWHNVIDLLQTWRFVQTAAADPEARKTVLNDELMGESIRYAVAHEMGHVLGLQHNLRASYAYPTDSLRSATFTQHYGTTASIMDYARNNYIAQPGDKEKGVRLTPPILGPHDYFSIQIGYKPIYETTDYSDEIPVLNQWFAEKSSDPMYLFAPTTVSPIVPDPSAQADALGNDLLKSARYGISNLKYITSHLVEWTHGEGDQSELLQKRFDAILKLHSRLTTLPLSYLGGVYELYAPFGHAPARFVPVERSVQKATVSQTVQQLADCQWINATDLNLQLGSATASVTDWQSGIIQHMLGNFILNRIVVNTSLQARDPYTLNEYLADLDREIWKVTALKKPTIFEQHLQINYIERLCVLVKSTDTAAAKQEASAVTETAKASAAMGQLVLTLEKINSLKGRYPKQEAHYALLQLLIERTLQKTSN